MGEHTIIYQPRIIRETAEGLNRLDIIAANLMPLAFD